MVKMRQVREQKEKKNQITEGVIWKQILLFFFPIMLGSLFQQFYNTADAMIVGRFVGKEALSAVGGSTLSIINILIGFSTGVSSGATVIVARFYGGKEEEKVSGAVHTALTLALVGGLLLGLLTIFFAPWMLRILKTPEDIFKASLNYLRIYFAACAANLFYNMGAGILRAVGDSKRPLYFLIASCIVNIFLDLLFVIGFGMGAEGAAIATALSQVLSAVLVCYVLLKSKECYRLIFSRLGFSGKLLKRILLIGIPAGLQSVTYGLSNSVIQSKVNSFGTDNIAAWTAYTKLDGFYWMSVAAMGISVTTFVGQNFGAKKMDRVKRSVKECMLMTMLMALALSAFFYVFAEFFFRLFSTDENVIALGVSQLHFLVPFYAVYAIVEILSGALRGMECVFVPTVISIVLVCVLRVGWLIVAIPIWNTMRTVLWSYPITWIAAAVAFLLYYGWFMKKRKYE